LEQITKRDYRFKARHLYHGISALEILRTLKKPEELERINNLFPTVVLGLEDIKVLEKAIIVACELLIK
jgi:hypothetical protein